MTEPALVTIVSPSFNQARYVGDCLRSIRAQTWPRVEHIVMDGGSTDGTVELLRTYEREHAARVFVERDEGQSDALNRGFARAQGDVLCWLNTDDYWLHPGVVERAMSLLTARPELDVVTAGGLYVDVSGQEQEPIPTEGSRTVARLPYYDTLLQPATFWRRRVHRPLRTDRHFTFDWLLFLEMARAGARFEVVEERWAAYRRYGDNKTSLDPARRRLEIAEVLKEQWGAGSVQHRWARLVAHGYGLSERVGLRALKSATAVTNRAMGWLTGRRIWSC